MEIAPRSGFVSDLFKGTLTIGALVLVGLVVQHDSRMLVADEGPSGGEATRTRSYVTALASDRMAGRLTGTTGERLAGDYIISELKRIGAKPLPGRTDYRFPFDFTSGGRDGGSRITVANCGPNVVDCIGSPHTGTDTVQALSFSDDGDVTGPIVFAGYGIVVPESRGFGYDSYATLDVKDKVVLVLQWYPEDADQKTKFILSQYANLRFKALQARQHGAKAMLVTTGPHSPNAGETIRMSFDTALSGSGIVAASVNAAVAGELFKNSGHSVEDAQHSLDTANPHVAGFALPGVVTIHTSVVREKRTGNDIVAYLPATTSTSGDPERVALQPAQKPWIAFGAHYDHLGRGEAGSTLATGEEAHQVHHGADDNASGDAAVLAAGAALAREARPRNVLLAFWSGEELGLIGSAAYVKAPPVLNNQIAAYLNFDMVGRMQDNKLTVQATGSSTAWPRILEQANITAGFDLILQEDPYQPTDVASFNQEGIPCLAFFTGTHDDYHKPSDTADKINYEDLARIADFAVAIARRVDDAEEPPAFVKVEQKASSGPGVAGVRVFTGTIPDYSNDVKGLLLSGVIGGGPAEQAGLQKGDIVVEIAGQTITNIYDYTYALDVLKIGTPTKVVYMRGGQRKETMLTPAARK